MSPDPAFPAHVARFELVEHDIGRAGSATVGYLLTGEDGSVSVTINAHPVRSGSLLPIPDESRKPAGTAEKALLRAKAQTHRFYPNTRVLEERATLLMNQGILQHGQMATLEFDDVFAGLQQPIRMTVYTFCCSRAGDAYEYRFRHAASFAAGPEVAAFLRALAWR